MNDISITGPNLSIMIKFYFYIKKVIKMRLIEIVIVIECFECINEYYFNPVIEFNEKNG